MRHFRVSEVFGPTIQGEGRQAGLPCYFIRFGGCDLRCTWCDTPFAVLPELVAQLPKESIDQILERLNSLPKGPQWVVISGGNPATLHLEDLVDILHQRGYMVMAETQGTVFNDWLRKVDELCISPKPPSSGNPVYDDVLFKFLGNFSERQRSGMYLKVVVFDDIDYDYAKDVHCSWPDYPFFVSAGTDDPTMPTVGNPNPKLRSNNLITQRRIRDTFRWLAEKISTDMLMEDVRVLPQLHVIAWGNERGR